MKSPPITLSDLKGMACAPLNQHLFEEIKKVKVKKISKEKVWIEYRLQDFAKENNLILQLEYRFDEVRKWRFDWCFPSLKIAYEYNGIFSAKSRHTTAGGYTGDMEKLNKAQELGWKVYQYTAINILDLRVDLLNIKIK